MEDGVNTIYVLGLPSATQIGLEHEEKNPKHYDHQPAEPPPPPPSGFAAVKDSIYFFLMKNDMINTYLKSH